nr:MULTISPECIES: transposase [unclassified Bradyrhizobium]
MNAPRETFQDDTETRRKATSQRVVQRSVSRRIYGQRNLVERFFCKLKHFRRIATRFDKLARNFLAAIALASARLWTRVYESTP